jgi:hypothetical protein
VVTQNDNHIAPPGMVYVCAACGKRSRDRYGDKAIDRGWDVSCFMHSVLCKESTLEIEDGRVVYGEAVGTEDE